MNASRARVRLQRLADGEQASVFEIGSKANHAVVKRATLRLGTSPALSDGLNNQ
jgi:hypothetical protein